MTLDSLIARTNNGSIHIGHDTTIFLDEAGMTDHTRLDQLTHLIQRSGAKLIAVGDGKQLPSIGRAGCSIGSPTTHPPPKLQDIHRTSDPAERKAWQALRAGEPEHPLAHYLSRGQLHLASTRDQAAENAVQAWGTLTRELKDIRNVALIADASNQEIDRLNARAQHLRAQRGELGPEEIPLPDVPYGIRQGDLIAFTRQHHPPQQRRIENGTRGEITAITPHAITITLDGSDRHINLEPQDLDALRLAYAQHVYRQQGATVERSIVLTGGWQTSRETAYVEATRARQGTDWYIARDELAEEATDINRIHQLATNMRNGRRQATSLKHRELPDPALELDPVARLMDPYWAQHHRPEPERDRDLGRAR